MALSVFGKSRPGGAYPRGWDGFCSGDADSDNEPDGFKDHGCGQVALASRKVNSARV